MNVFEKLNEARVRFQNDGIKKTGKNSYAGYTYYELADILPAINKLAKELKFVCITEFTPELATLKFVDVEKPEDMVLFTSPMSEASLKGCHQVQNLGAVETYIKRYLYQNCFEIVESDCLDMTMGKDIQKLCEKVQIILNTPNNGLDEKQIAYAQKCITTKDKKGLEIIIEKTSKK